MNSGILENEMLNFHFLMKEKDKVAEVKTAMEFTRWNAYKETRTIALARTRRML